VLLNAVLEAYLGTHRPGLDPRFPSAPVNQTLNVELYGDEFQRCVWRLAIECVKDREFSLAECLFVMHMLLEHPDLYMILFDVSVPDSLVEILRDVCYAADYTRKLSPEQTILNVGRMWAGLYAHRLCGITTAASYATALHASTTATPAILSMLLGLNETTPPIVAAGCVSYFLDMETKRTTPSIESVPGMLQFGSSSSFDEFCALDAGRTKPFESLVMQAHAFRLARKPYVPQPWSTTVAQRVTMSRAAPHEKLQLSHAEDGVVASPSYAATIGETNHMVPLSKVVDSLTSYPQLRKAVHDRHRLSYVAYSSAPGEASLSGTSGSFIKKLSPAAYDLIYNRETTHGNFYATIECGRLMAMIHNVRNGRHATMDAFAAAYLAECAELDQRAGMILSVQSGETNSWWTAKGVRYDATRHVIGNNIVSQADDLPTAPRSAPLNSDPTLHYIITRAIAAGKMRCAGPLTNAMIRMAESRLVVPKALHDVPLTLLARFQPAHAAGCGTPTTPHIGVASAVRSAKLGEEILLIPGRYRAFAVRHASGTLDLPLVIRPLQYLMASGSARSHRHPRIGISADVTTEGGISDVASAVSETFDVSNPLWEAVRASCNTTESGGSRPERTYGRVIIAHDAASRESEPLIMFEKCQHVRVRDLVIGVGRLGVKAQQVSDVKLEGCVVFSDLPSASDGDVVAAFNDNIIRAPPSLMDRILRAGNLNAEFRLAGYALFTVVFALFAALCFALSAGFTNSEANEWIVRSVVTTLFVALVIQPVTVAATSAFGFASALVFHALTRVIGIQP
jgi:hypothetical protein